MQAQNEVLRKLDARLLGLMTGGDLSGSETVPVFIIASEAAQLDALVGLVERAGGRVRHVMRRLNAFSAWVSNDLLQDLAEHPFVEGLEAPQPIAIA